MIKNRAQSQNELDHLRVHELSQGSNLNSAYNLLKELRTRLSFEDFSLIYQSAFQDGYRIYLCSTSMHEDVGLIGMRVVWDFVRGRHLYIDDLVVCKSHRGQGIGSFLLQWAEDWAKEHDISKLRLCTGLDNEDAQKFYVRNNWEPIAWAYVKKV